MKIVYSNRAMNRQRGGTPSLKAILLVSCLIATMTAVKVMYDPDSGMEEIEAMAYSYESTEESEEVE